MGNNIFSGIPDSGSKKENEDYQNKASNIIEGAGWKGYYNELLKSMKEFEDSLGSNEELRIRLGNSGISLYKYESLRYQDPGLVIFEGRDADSKVKIRLVQHVSQISFLFVAIPVAGAERIGFKFQ